MRTKPDCEWPRKCPQNSLQAVAHAQVRSVTRCPVVHQLWGTPVSQVKEISACTFAENQGGLEGIPHLRKEYREPQSSHIHQKHFFFTFLLFRRKSCFSGTGASAGDLGGEGASSAGSASSRLWRTSWNLPSCCRKSYSTLEDREEGRG